MPSTKTASAVSPKFMRVNPANLLFDPENPRFGEVSFAGRDAQEQIQSYLYEKPNYASELVESFVQNGFIEYEPLVVRPSGQNWIIVEGNRRLSAIRHIVGHPEKYAAEVLKRLKSIPVITFPEPTGKGDNDAIRVYLGVRHLFGFREWPPNSKALFLDAEIKKPGGLKKILDEMRISKDTVRRLVVPLRLLRAANKELDPSEDYWTLAEALSGTGTKKFISLVVNPTDYEIVSFDRSRFDELLSFLYGKDDRNKRDPNSRVISETREVKVLSKVLESSKAYKLLAKSRSLDNAAILVDTRAETIKRLERLSKTLPSLVNQVTTGFESQDATELRQTSSAFSKAATKFLRAIKK